MAFTYTIKTATGGEQVFGASKVVFGTFTSAGGSTGGDIKTGLARVDCIYMTASAAAVGNAPVANETFPLSSGDVTIISDANETGTWFAIGA